MKVDLMKVKRSRTGHGIKADEKRKTIDWAAVKRRLQDKFREEIKGKSDEELREAYLKGIKEGSKDPIIDEVRRVREKLGKEMQMDPKDSWSVHGGTPSRQVSKLSRLHHQWVKRKVVDLVESDRVYLPGAALVIL